MQRRLYIDEAHTALDIFRFAVFFPGNLNSCVVETKEDLHIISPFPPFSVSGWLGGWVDGDFGYE